MHRKVHSGYFFNNTQSNSFKYHGSLNFIAAKKTPLEPKDVVEDRVKPVSFGRLFINF